MRSKEAEAALGRVTARDVEVLEFVARYGVVPRDAVAVWAETARAMTARRERRLRGAGLLSLTRLPYRSEPFLLATRPGLQLCTRDELSVARPTATRLAHFAAAARLGARLERAGETLLSERELLAHERALGEHSLSIRLTNGHLHRPDMLIVPPGTAPDEWGRPWAKRKPTVLEVELTQKGGQRLDRILFAWRGEITAGRFAALRYYCSTAALPYVRRSAERVCFGPELNATLLPAQCPPVDLQRRGSGRAQFLYLKFLSNATPKISRSDPVPTPLKALFRPASYEGEPDRQAKEPVMARFESAAAFRLTPASPSSAGWSGPLNSFVSEVRASARESSRPDRVG